MCCLFACWGGINTHALHTVHRTLLRGTPTNGTKRLSFIYSPVRVKTRHYLYIKFTEIYTSIISISILRLFGMGTLITNRSARSSIPKSISRLCTRISNRSHVAVPSPQGERRVVILSFLVGRGTGPRKSTPVFSAISRIYVHVLLSSSICVLASLIRAFCMVHLVYECCKRKNTAVVFFL